MGAKVGSNLEVANGTKMFIAYYPLKAVNNASNRWTVLLMEKQQRPATIPVNIIMLEEEMLIQSTCHYNDHICVGS
jgi:hypothetical protein